MRHRKRGRKLGVSVAHRKAMGRNMIQGLIDVERIITTVPKAKHYQPLAEKIIHLGKEKTLSNVRRARALLGDRKLEIDFVEDDAAASKKTMKKVLQKLFDDVGPRNHNRQGGYTRIIRLAKRRKGDGGERCIFELVEGADIKAGGMEAVTREEEKEAAHA